MEDFNGVIPVVAAVFGVLLGVLIRQFIAAAGIRAATVRARSIVEESRQQQSALIISAKGEISRMRVAAEAFAKSENRSRLKQSARA